MVQGTDLKKEKILILESDAAAAGRIVEALKEDGYENSSFEIDGNEALNKIYNILPHLIVLDVTLSNGVTGYQILEKKQKEPLLAKIPVFMMSTEGTPINMRMIPDDSVSEFLMALHSDIPVILNKINEHFGHTSAISMIGAKGVSSDPTKKMLWVEDDKLIGMILSKKLLASGFDLVHAKNGNEAMEALKTFVPKVIVVDLILPGMNGFDVLQNIRMEEKFKDIPTMVLSNLSKQSDIEKAKMLGAKKFLVKAATSIDQIVAEIKELCV